MLIFPKTKGQWIATGLAAFALIGFLVIFTKVFEGHAIEISVENASASEIFAYIDKTGRHGDGANIEKIDLLKSGQTPNGIRIKPATTRSFGLAVGLFDFPTLHLLPIQDGRADMERVTDCPFATISLTNLEIPKLNIRLRWDGTKCQVS